MTTTFAHGPPAVERLMVPVDRLWLAERRRHASRRGNRGAMAGLRARLSSGCHPVARPVALLPLGKFRVGSVRLRGWAKPVQLEVLGRRNSVGTVDPRMRWRGLHSIRRHPDHYVPAGPLGSEPSL